MSGMDELRDQAAPKPLTRVAVDAANRKYEATTRAWQAQGCAGALNALRSHVEAPRSDAAPQSDHPDAVPAWLTRYDGICPRCLEWKFIGHGPLCADCFLAPHRDDHDDAEPREDRRA